MSTLPVAEATTVITHPGAGLRRACAVVALAAAPVLLGASSVLQPDLGDSAADRFAAMPGVGPAVSVVTFVLAQLPMLVAVLALGHLLRSGARRLAAWGTVIGFAGAYGETVVGGAMVAWLPAANDGATHRAAYAQGMDEMMNSPVMLFSLLGLAGTVIGLLLLSIGLYRAQVGPRWVGPALWLFLVVEFVGTSLSEWAAYLSPLCFAAPFLALAVYASRQPLETWAGRVSRAAA
jgi:hypothetical protein